MLSRTAQSLFWMARYMERAENTARLIEMGSRMTMLPGSWGREEWRSVARVSGCEELLASEAQISQAAIVRSLMLDPANPCSIRSCLDRARANARSVRIALTRDMWEAVNENWRRLETVDVATASRDLPVVLDWVKQRGTLLRGAIETSMLRDDRYDFLNIGAFLERADMMLRLLDVKYYVLLPETEVVGGGRDHHQWTSLLHATSATRAYHHVYRGDYAPWKIADFMILNRRFPRSLCYCYYRVDRALSRLERAYGGRHDCHETAAGMIEQLGRLEMGEIFHEGLHEFVLGAVATNRQLSAEIYRAYHF